jgi:hypothetical protein
VTHAQRQGVRQYSRGVESHHHTDRKRQQQRPHRRPTQGREQGTKESTQRCNRGSRVNRHTNIIRAQRNSRQAIRGREQFLGDSRRRTRSRHPSDRASGVHRHIFQHAGTPWFGHRSGRDHRHLPYSRRRSSHTSLLGRHRTRWRQTPTSANGQHTNKQLLCSSSIQIYIFNTDQKR